MLPAQRPELTPGWPALPAVQAGKARLDQARQQDHAFEVTAREERSRGRGENALMLARYGFARAVMDPTLFAQALAAEDAETPVPDYTGRKRYAQTLSDRQIPLTPGEVVDLRI